MKTIRNLITLILFIGCATSLRAQVPQMISCQGRVLSGGMNFTGAGQFKFALLDSAGAVSYWSNDGTSSGGSQPANFVTLSVTNGLFNVMLGDTSLTNMTASIPPSVFANADVRLRIWFNDGTRGFQQLGPDQRLGSSGYAMQSASATLALTIADGAVTAAKLASDAASLAKISGGVMVNSNGNVGIGTASPQYPLDVSGTVRATAFINTGSGNTESGHLATISGGMNNNASGDYAYVGGGAWNTASGLESSVGGGHYNTASGMGAVVGGGGEDGGGGALPNVASGLDAVVPGGAFNVAGGKYSFAAGYRAKATRDGSFVWADSQQADFESAANNQFLIRASGGVGIGTSNPQYPLDVSGTVRAMAFQGAGTGTNVFNGQIKAAGGLVIETRSGSDPPNPATGQLWLRTDP